MSKIENMLLQPSTIYSCPLQTSQSAFFPVKPFVQLYSDRKPRACQKLGNGPGFGKCPAPGQCKICKCLTPGSDKEGKCPAVARGSLAQVELTDALLSNITVTQFGDLPTKLVNRTAAMLKQISSHFQVTQVTVVPIINFKTFTYCSKFNLCIRLEL